MSTFTYTPSYSISLNKNTRVRAAQFGDGYAQRSGDGINTIMRSWSLKFDNDTNLDAIETFFETQGGVTSFTWVPPVGLTGKWVCGEWSRNLSDINTGSITANFTEVFGE
jgi:phage-related protein